jgi:hypothetical protein
MSLRLEENRCSVVTCRFAMFDDEDREGTWERLIDR